MQSHWQQSAELTNQTRLGTHGEGALKGQELEQSDLDEEYSWIRVLSMWKLESFLTSVIVDVP